MVEDKSKQQLELLYDLLKHGLTDSNNPANVGRQALDLILRSHSILRGEIFVLDDRGILRLLALSGYDHADISIKEKKVEERLQQELIHQVLEREEGLTIPDVGCQDYWMPIPDLDEDICSVAVLPMIADEKVLGVMSLLSAETGYFTEERLPLLNAISTTVALVIKNARLFRQVQSGQEQLRKLAEQLVNVQEMERKSVSRTLHDETGQTLTALRMQLVAMEREVSADSTLLENIKEADNLLGETINRIRRLAYTLRPPELDTLGLSAALQRLCQDFRQYYKNIEIAYQGEEIPTLPESISISFYRCLQEALTNVAKHAEATNVKVEFSQNGKEIHLEVQDNGNGHAASSSQSLGGLGLLGMRERFERIDGKLTVVSDRESGTRLTATVPWEE